MTMCRRNEYLLRVVCAALTLAAGCTNQINHNQKIRTQKSEPGIQKTEDWQQRTDDTTKYGPPATDKCAREDWARLPGRILEDSKFTFFKNENITALLLAGGASVAMHNSDADENLAGNFEKHRGFAGLTDKGLDLIGGPGFHFAVTGLWYAVSAENQDQFNKERAFTMITALSITGLTTVGLKAIRNNKTPNGKSWAWPSGHTSSSFTVAAVLDEFYGPRVGVPAYILACLVGWRMMDTGDHWGSDVVFGATLGWIVGHSVASRHKQLEIAGFEVLPYTAGNGSSVIGICLVKQF